jgi:hypothetical protein
MRHDTRRECDFRWKDFVGLPVADQIRKCHEMATEANDLAAVAGYDTREVYLTLAQQWSNLAREIQNSEQAAA